MRHLLVAAFCGVLSALAFEPFTIPFAMIVAVAILLGMLRGLGDARKRLVLGIGLVYGLAFMGPLIWWMRAVSDGAYVALVIAESIFVAVIVLALRSAVRLPAWPIWAAGVWVLGESARGAFPFTGFPWGRLVHTSIDTPFAPWVRLLGMPATSALLVLVAASLVVLVEGAGRRRLVAVGGIVAAVMIGFLLPTGAPSTDGSIRAAVVQGDVPGEFLTWPRGAIFQLQAAETRRLADRVEAGTVPRPDIVLLPENATDIDPSTDAAVADQITALSRRLDAPILLGGIFDTARNDEAENAGEVWTADGPGERYVKRKVVPYGEYVPFRQELGSIVPRVNRDIPRDFVSGDEPGLIDLAGVQVGDTICWDIAYDGIVREALGPDAQARFLVVQTSNAAFTGTSQPEQQWAISRLRALETGRAVAVPSTNGISGVISPDGSVVERAPVRTAATVEARVPLATGSTPARRLEAPLEWLLVAVGLAGWLWGARRGRLTARPRRPRTTDRS